MVILLVGCTNMPIPFMPHEGVKANAFLPSCLFLCIVSVNASDASPAEWRPTEGPYKATSH